MPPRTVPRNPALDAIFQDITNRATEARQLEEAQRGGGVFGGVTGLVSKGLAKGASGVGFAVGTSLKVLDLPRQWVSKPLLGAVTATVEGKWGQVGNINDLRTIWDEANVPGPLKFAAELGTDPLIFFGGFGFFKGTGVRLASQLLHNQGIIKGSLSGARFTRAAWKLANDPGILSLEKSLVAGEKISTATSLRATLSMQKAGLVGEGTNAVRQAAAALRNADPRTIRSLMPGIIARKVGPLSRVLGPTEAAWEALWNVPISVVKPFVLRAAGPISKSAGIGINAFGRTQLARKTASFLSSRSQFAADVGAFMDAGRPLVGKGSIFTTPTAESVKRMAYDSWGAASKDLERVAALTGLAEHDVMILLKNEDEQIIRAFKSAAPGLEKTETMETLELGMGVMEPEDFQRLLIRGAETGEAGFNNMMRSNVERGLADSLGVISAPEIEQPILMRGMASILNAMRPTILARPDFALVETPDNFLRAGNIHALNSADFDFLLGHGLPEQLSAGKIGVGESFVDALIPIRVFREKKVAGKVAGAIFEPLDPTDAAFLQREIDELPAKIAEDIGSFIAAPDARLEALEQMPLVPAAFKRFVKGYQRRMASVDGRAATNAIWEASSDHFTKNLLSAPPQTIRRETAALQGFFQRLEDAGINPNAMQKMRRIGQRIMAGEKGSLDAAARELSLDSLTMADAFSNKAFQRLPRTAQTAIITETKASVDSGVPAAFAFRDAVRNNGALAYRTAGENVTRHYNLVKSAKQNYNDIFTDLGINRAKQTRAVLGSYNNTVKRVETLERKFQINKLGEQPLPAAARGDMTLERRGLKTQLQEGKLAGGAEAAAEDRIVEINEVLQKGTVTVESGVSRARAMKNQRYVFELANDDIDLTAAGSLSMIARGRGRTAAEFLPYQSFDAELSVMIDNRLHNGMVHLQDYANAVAKEDSSAALSSLKKMGRLFPELKGLGRAGAIIPPNMLAQTYADIQEKMWRRFLTAKVVGADEIAARATSVKGRFDPRSYNRLLNRMVKEVIGAEDLGVVRLKSAVDNVGRYGFNSDMLPALEAAENAYPALADSLLQKWEIATPKGAIRQIDESFRELQGVVDTFLRNEDYNRAGIQSVLDLMDDGAKIARDPGVRKEMSLRFSQSLQTAGIEGWRNKMVDYRFQTGVDRLAGFFSLFPVWGLRLPGYLMRQFVERPGFIFGMNHIIQSGAYGDLGMGFGGGMFWAPHLRMSMLPIIARKGQSFTFEGDHPLNQIGNFIESLGLYPGPRAQTALAVGGGFLNQTGITTGQSEVDPQFIFGTLPEFRWLRDITATMGINEAQGFQVPVLGGSSNLFDRAVERELASRVTSKLEAAQQQAGRQLYDDEISDIRQAVRAEELISARKSVAARDFALSQLPGLRYVSPEEIGVTDAARQFLQSKNMKVKRTRAGVLQGFRKLSPGDQQQMLAELPAFKEFISLPSLGESGKARTFRVAKENYFRTVDQIWAPVSRQQRILDNAFEAGEITAKEYRTTRSDNRTNAVSQVEGLRQEPVTAAWLARAERGIEEDPVRFALKAYQQIEPVDIDGDGLILRADMKQFFDARRNFLDGQPVWIQDAIKTQHRATLTPLETQYENAREHLNGYYDIPRYQGLSLEESERASKVIAQANALNRVTRGAQTVIQTIMQLPGAPGLDKNLAIRALSAGRNPARARYWVQFPDLNVFFPDLAPGGLEIAG